MGDWIGPILSGAALVLTAGAALWTAKNANKVENLRSSLERGLFEHQTRFSRLHDRRLEVIAEVYSRIVAVEEAARLLVVPLREAGTEPESDSRQRVIDEYNQLWTYFSRHRIFLPSDLSDELEELTKRMRRAMDEFIRLRISDDSGMVRSEGTRTWLEIWNEVSDDLPKVRKSIEAEFRSLLDVVRAEPLSESGE